MSDSIVKKSGIQEPPEPVRMPILVLRGLVLFPQMVLHFDVGREKSLLALNKVMSGDRRIFLVAQKDIRDDEPKAQNLYKIGVVAQVKQIIKSQGGTWRVLVEGLYRAKLIEVLGEEPYFEGQVVEFPLRITRSIKSAMCNALMRTVKELFEEYCYLTPRMPKELVVNALISGLVSCELGNIQMEVADNAILSQSEPLKRLEILAHLLEEENDILSLEADIQEKVKGQVDKNQREYYLREQLKVISNELGEDDEQDEAADYYERIEKLKLDGQTAEKLRKEVDRLTKLPGNSNEAGVIRGYLDTVLELPWDKCTLDKIDIKKAGALLEGITAARSGAHLEHGVPSSRRISRGRSSVLWDRRALAKHQSRGRLQNRWDVSTRAFRLAACAMRAIFAATAKRTSARCPDGS
ncbi:MAG: LON peptidase substrate-binding domain-containing protein [Anaerotruncus colihominis]